MTNLTYKASARQSKKEVSETTVEEDSRTTSAGDTSRTAEEVPSDINMDLEEGGQKHAKDEFYSDNKVPNIWSHIDNEATSEDTSKGQSPKPAEVGSIYEDEEIEKPSFLRRLTRRGDKKSNTDK